eukprot:3939093-Rhodomonas_salina.2
MGSPVLKKAEMLPGMKEAKGDIDAIGAVLEVLQWDKARCLSTWYGVALRLLYCPSCAYAPTPYIPTSKAPQYILQSMILRFSVLSYAYAGTRGVRLAAAMALPMLVERGSPEVLEVPAYAYAMRCPVLTYQMLYQPTRVLCAVQY